MTAIMSPVNHRDPLFRDRTSAADVPMSGFTAVNGRTSPARATTLNGQSSNTPVSILKPHQESRPAFAHTNAYARKMENSRDIDVRVAQRADMNRSSPGRSSPLPSPAKRKRMTSDAETEQSSRMVSLPSRTGTNTSTTTTNTAVTARASPPRRLETVSTFGPDSGAVEHSQEEDLESADEHEGTSIDPDADPQDRSWHVHEGSERYRSHPGSEGPHDHSGQLSRMSTGANGQDPGLSSELDRRDTEVSEVTAAGVQVLNPKKRKRVFSNRTKTGCQTCRKRKKKCDEQKPECGNCIRGSFVCEGYVTKATWTKPSSGKAPVRLQSKNGYSDSSPSYHGGALPRDQYEPAQPARPRLVPAEDPHGGGWQKQQQQPSWSDAQLSHYASDSPARNDFPRAPTLPDMSRRDTRMSDYAPSANLHRSSQSYHTSPLQSVSTIQPAVAAQLALQYQNGHRPSSSMSGPIQTTPQRMTEKEKMLQGYPYQPYCQELEEDRDVCKANVWRFNEVNNPMNLISRSERELKFRAILETGMSRNLAGQPSSGSNRLGRNVRVEAPFACEFGYNIDVHDDVVISRNCSIMDADRVTLLPGCFLYPNVSVFTASMSTNPNLRDPRHREFQGRPVTIGENAVVGTNVVIYPGVTIGKNSTICAGSVVDANIPADVVAAGNPAKILGAVPDSPPAPQPRMIEQVSHPQHYASAGPPPPPPPQQQQGSHHSHGHAPHGSHGSSHPSYMSEAYSQPTSSAPQPPTSADPGYGRSSVGSSSATAAAPQTTSGPPSGHAYAEAGYAPAEQHPSHHQHHHGHHPSQHQQHQIHHQQQQQSQQHAPPPPQHPHERQAQYHDDPPSGSGGAGGNGRAGYYEGQTKGLRPVHPRPPVRA